MTTEPDINVPIEYVRGVGPKRTELLDRLGVRTVRDLLYFFPRKYHDRRNLIPIAQAELGTESMILGDVVRVSLHRKGRGRGVLTVTLEDETGTLKAVWFNQNYLSEKFRTGDTVLVWGLVRDYKGPQMVNPMFEHVGADEHGGVALTEDKSKLVPVYPLTEGLMQGQVRSMTRAALDDFGAVVPELLDDDLRAKYGFPGVREALLSAHFPDTAEQKDAAKRRFIFEEFFLFELAVALRRDAIKHASGIEFAVAPDVDTRIRQRFPFALTPGQDAAIREIVADMQSPEPMNRLLQGDVGCGKTVVALYAMLVATANRYQSAFMAPTEILAEQHYRRLSQLLSGSKVRLRLLTGSLEDRRGVLADIERGDADIVIGTHAVIQADVAFHQLGLVIIDEQHKFGVMQRARLRWKGHSPDTLVMTATPIPRTLALTIFGDLDISVIRDLPPGRRPPITTVFPPAKIDAAFDLIRAELAAGRQAYVVCPIIEQSETMDLRSAEETAEELQSKVFPEFRVGLLHGRMLAEEKERVMSAFARREIDILVSTIVIEVGIDIPNASVMLILHADRFGLAQLHQLRGRIGRGSAQAHCLLEGDPKSDDAEQRLRILAETCDGFRIAEEDLRIRGTGDLLGTRQHGLPDIRLGDLTGDLRVLEDARDDAARLVAADPHLTRPEHAALRRRMLDLHKDRPNLIHVG